MPSTEDPDSEASVCGVCWICAGGVHAPGMLDVQVECTPRLGARGRDGLEDRELTKIAASHVTD